MSSPSKKKQETSDSQDLADLWETEEQDKIQKCLLNQLPAVSITSLDAVERATIIDELLCSEDTTLFPLAVPLAVQMFDRYFASISQSQVALDPREVAACALHLASGQTRHFNNMLGANNIGTEFQIMNCVQYRLNIPTTLDLVEAFLSSSNMDDVTASLAVYLTKLALLDRDCSGFQIAILAGGCIFLAQFVFDPDNAPRIQVPWECDAQQLRNAVTILRELLLGSRLSQCRGFRTRFPVSLVPTCPEIPDAYFG